MGIVEVNSTPPVLPVFRPAGVVAVLRGIRPDHQVTGSTEIQPQRELSSRPRFPAVGQKLMRGERVTDSGDGDFGRVDLPIVSGVLSPERFPAERDLVQKLAQVREFLDQFRSLGMDEREDALPGVQGGQRFLALGERENTGCFIGRNRLGAWKVGLSGLHTADGQPLAAG